MAIKKMKWEARFGFRVLGFPSIKFIGRERFLPTNEAHKKALLALGVFTEDGDNLYYSAPIKFVLNDDTKAWVDSEGIIEYEETKLPEKYLIEIKEIEK